MSSDKHVPNGKYVSREKYERCKSKLENWYKKAKEYMEEINKLLDLNGELEQKVEELSKENSLLKKEVDSAKKTDHMQVQNLREKVSSLQRDIILKDGKIQQLEEARRDLKERYNELKEDYRDQQRWMRNQSRDRGKEVSAK